MLITDSHDNVIIILHILLLADKEIVVRCTDVHTTGKRKWDKRYPCLYCEKLYPKLPRHYQSRHHSEAEVQQLGTLEKNPKDDEDTKKRKLTMRKNLIEQMRKKGTHWHNVRVFEKGHGEIIVEKRPSSSNAKSFDDYLPCEHCLG